MPSVLVINRVYPPNDGATGQLLAELSEALAREGWRVTILTSGSPSTHDLHSSSSAVHRVRGLPFTRTSFWKRALSYLALYPALLNMDARSYGVIAAVSVAALAIGHLLGPRDSAEKTVLAVECAVRHPGLAVTIAATNFTPERALPVLVPCILTFIAIATVYLIWRGRSA